MQYQITDSSLSHIIALIPTLPPTLSSLHIHIRLFTSCTFASEGNILSLDSRLRNIDFLLSSHRGSEPLTIILDLRLSYNEGAFGRPTSTEDEGGEDSKDKEEVVYEGAMKLLRSYLPQLVEQGAVQLTLDEVPESDDSSWESDGCPDWYL